VPPIELGWFDGLNITQTFNEKDENGYINHIENLNTDNKGQQQTLKEELQIKNEQIERLMKQLEVLLSKIK